MQRPCVRFPVPKKRKKRKGEVMEGYTEAKIKKTNPLPAQNRNKRMAEGTTEWKGKFKIKRAKTKLQNVEPPQHVKGSVSQQKVSNPAGKGDWRDSQRRRTALTPPDPAVPTEGHA